MTPSKEVDAVTGVTPERAKDKTPIDVVQLLNDKRLALNGARERYSAAKAMRDEQAMSNSSRVIDSLKEIIAELEREAAVEVEAAGRKAAEERLLGIRRAYGSNVASYQDDEARVQQAVAALGEAITTLNGRARKLEALRAEAAALADRFALTVPILTMVSEPQENVVASLPTPWQYRGARPSFEQCEHGLRERRDYAEIGGTPGYAIIQTAGLRPFRPLTEREREVLEDERKPDPVLAAAAVEATALSNLGVPGAHVHRG